MDPISSIPTVTQREQWTVEEMVSEIYQLFSSVPHHAQTIMLELRRDQHIEFLTRGLRQLGPSFRVLDANRPWLCYWILHSIALLGESIFSDLENNSIDFLNRCQDPDGGYGGGPGQLPHLATTYAAVNALMTLGGQKALSSINRDKMRTFLLRMKDPSGGFRMHDGGEMDVRACYTAISVASVLNILDPELVENVGNYILSSDEGYLDMLLINHKTGFKEMLYQYKDWVAFRQGVECGFQGRANKLVDGCYSFWQGAVFALIQRLNSIIVEQLRALDVGGSLSWRSICTGAASNLSEGECGSDVKSYQTDERFHAKQKEFSDIGLNFIKIPAELGPLFHSVALQQYILLCSQVQDGGFRDKPGKHRDYYHTCYCLSGLAVCQYSWCKDADSPPLPKAVLGPHSNLLEPIHPLFNVVLHRYYEAHNFFMGS
ncbi:PREDICTED: protein farnesyltransferase subunit beta isoform X2 [Nelumbo nucifera]|uniref:Protein farnesyltransferase subunit beta n=2 Tax=Nelumbo nucifera TaxID=4432 RepID=A0A1U7YUS2_NELNU|nr:PREDICTED: protein farnesyltransferase subunit beta isoform X2 [Nelumbo nucifera]